MARTRCAFELRRPLAPAQRDVGSPPRREQVEGLVERCAVRLREGQESQQLESERRNILLPLTPLGVDFPAQFLRSWRQTRLQLCGAQLTNHLPPRTLARSVGVLSQYCRRARLACPKPLVPVRSPVLRRDRESVEERGGLLPRDDADGVSRGVLQ